MRIGIDIDGVLTNIEQFVLDYISKYCVENNIEYNISDMNYEYAKTFNISREIELDFWNTYLEEYAVNEKARPFASEIINKLKEDGHEIYIITARWLSNRDDDVGKNMREMVKKWLSENKIVYDKLVFSKAEKEKKSQEIMGNKIDLMIEDSPNNINELSKNVPVICYNAQYNKECSGNKIIRCYSWYDIYNKISILSNKINKKLEDFIKNNEVEHTKNFISKEKLEKIILKYNIEMGKQLKEYIIKYGYLSYKHIEFLGINNIQNEESDLIRNTLYLNKMFKKTKNLIVIENKGDGEYYLVDKEDNIYRYLLDDDKLELQYLKFFDYILKSFEEV